MGTIIIRNTFDKIFDTCADYMAIPVYIGSYHFTIGGVLEVMLFILIVAVILRVLLGRF